MVKEDEYILFLGDSYTWGEGLELYSDDPKWVSERTNINQWLNLRDKQDNNSIYFRESNRFSYLASSEIGCMDLVDPFNGGALQSMIDFADKSFLMNKKINNIFIQFSNIDRDSLHGTFNCICDICIDAEWPAYYETMLIIFNKKLKNLKLSKTDNLLINYTETHMNMSIDDISFLNKFELFFIENRKKVLLNIYNSYFRKWVSRGKNLYIIDSWDKRTSDILFKIPEYSQHIINLIGYNGRKYKKWEYWNLTFDKKTISDDFPYTHNNHPSLTQHQFIAKSIIEILDKKDI